MDIVVKERLKNEMKVLAYRRKISKNKSRKLMSDSARMQKNYAKAKEDGNPLAEDYWYAAVRKEQAYYYLRDDGASRARHMNIAYGLLKGTPYRNIERTCRVKPTPEYILKIIIELCLRRDRKNWTIEIVKSLLA